jgi:prepilin-type N-terminal cleavage/methylation domain-containing protein
MSRQRGFTIIELMIATVVFSMVLLVLAGGLLQIGRSYYKGVASARTQEVARSVVDDIAQNIQMTGGTIIPTNGTMNNGIVSGTCVGSRRYSFARTQQFRSGTHHRLVADNVTGGCIAGPGGTRARSDSVAGTGMIDPLTGGGQEMLGERMRVVNFQVTQNPTDPRLYAILLRVAYGDDDLLCSPGMAGDCTVVGVSPSIGAGRTDLICKDVRAGTQHCAVAEIVTTVVKRL